jgi:flagellar hook assembly protein FlgD
LPEQCRLTISIYDTKGVLVRTLFEGNQAVGNHSVNWNSQTNDGTLANPGIYFCRLITDDHSETLKMLLSK